MRKNTLTTESIEHMQLVSALKETQNALESAYSVFENVTDTDLIDCAIYEINALQLRYKFLLARAKEYSPEVCEKSVNPLEAANFKYHEFVH